MTDATICSAGQGPCNDPTLGEFLPFREMVSPPQSLFSTEFLGAPVPVHAPSRAPKAPKRQQSRNSPSRDAKRHLLVTNVTDPVSRNVSAQPGPAGVQSSELRSRRYRAGLKNQMISRVVNQASNTPRAIETIASTTVIKRTSAEAGCTQYALLTKG